MSVPKLIGILDKAGVTEAWGDVKYWLESIVSFTFSLNEVRCSRARTKSYRRVVVPRCLVN